VLPVVSKPAPDVVILGAGFSKALSQAMPLTDELGEDVLKVVQGSTLRLPERFSGGQFEAWLSRIAEDQPDLSVADNLANRALFQRCSEALALVLNDRTEGATEEASSRAWLRPFLNTLHVRRATVITFNQDILIERSIGDAGLHSWGERRWAMPVGQRQITWHDLLDDQPSLPNAGTRLASFLPEPTFRLLKLHGSTNWFWRPGDASGVTVARWFLPGTVPRDEAQPDEAAALRRALPGRVPLIVPPAASKSGYYQTPILTQLWQDARAALSAENVRVSLVGYSIPPTDLVTSGMLRETLFDRTSEPVRLDVVNLDITAVRDRLMQLGASLGQITGIDAVGDFAVQYEQRAAEELVEQFRRTAAAESDWFLLAGSSIRGALKVVGIAPGPSGDLELTLEDARPPHAGTNRSVDGAPPALGLARLVDGIQRGDAKRLVAITPAGLRRRIIGATSHITDNGAGTGEWQVLITSEPLADGDDGT
jgi:hypothetical protein